MCRDVRGGKLVAGGEAGVRLIHKAKIKSRGRAASPAAMTCFSGKQMLALAKGNLRSMKESSLARAASEASGGSRVLYPPLLGGGRPDLGQFQGRVGGGWLRGGRDLRALEPLEPRAEICRSFGGPASLRS